MKLFRKMDEMEEFISMKGLKLAYLYTVIFLFIWAIFDFINGRTPSTALFLLITQNLILSLSQLFFKKKLDK